MRVLIDKIHSECAARRLTQAQLLKKARVSKTAYYALIKSESIVPKSLIKIAKALAVCPSELVEDPLALIQKTRGHIKICEHIIKENAGVEWQHAWHTLILLEEEPIDRLRRALLRAQNRTQNI